jgi:hypothetical protein
MVTLEQLREQDRQFGQMEFHANGCTRTVGPRGGLKGSIERWRQSGRLQTWKRNPKRFRLPIKHGLRDSYAIDDSNTYQFHFANDCPLDV